MLPVRTPAGRLGTAVVTASAVILFLVGAQAAHAAPGSGQTAVVTLGDSYISGEAGRWAGNSVDPAPGNDGTDRACQPAGPACQVDKSRVYVGGSDSNGCHRSDTAEVMSARLAVDKRINIACSGAVTTNIFRAASGGTTHDGEPPQADQLLPIARADDVKMIVVSIGGNDLGFASIVQACLTAYVAKQPPCMPSQQRAIDSALPGATAKVEKAIDEIRAVMGEAGYSDSDYRLVMQTYPSVVPRASEARYGEATQERTAFGCGFYDVDLTWARDQAAPEIGTMVKTAAAARGVEVLDLKDALQGHEFCSKSTSESTPLAQPDAAHSEWGRFLAASTVQQGDLQEAFHPNSYAQRAFGTCVTKLFTQLPGRFTCSGAAGASFDAMTLTRVGTTPVSQPTSPAATLGRLRLSVRRVAARSSRRSCFAFTVTAAGKKIRGARVRFTGHAASSDRRGRAKICTGAHGSHRAVATRRGYRRATRAVRIRRARAVAPSFTG